MYASYLDKLQQFLPSKEKRFAWDESLDLKGLQFLITRIPCKTQTEEKLINMLYDVCEIYQYEHQLLKQEFEKSWQQGFEEENA